MNNIDDNRDNWRELAVASQSGDKRAYADLLNAIVPYIKQHIISGLANSDWVDEIVQDVLISIHRSLTSYSSDRQFKPWLNAIIAYRRTDFLRKHYKNKNLAEVSKDSSITFGSSVKSNPYAGELKDIEEALVSLPLKQQKIVKLLKIDGYSVAEVAYKMGMSVSAVKVAAHRAIQKIKSKLLE